MEKRMMCSMETERDLQFIHQADTIKLLTGWCFQPTKEKYESDSEVLLHPQVRVESKNIRNHHLA